MGAGVNLRKRQSLLGSHEVDNSGLTRRAAMSLGGECNNLLFTVVSCAVDSSD